VLPTTKVDKFNKPVAEKYIYYPTQSFDLFIYFLLFFKKKTDRDKKESI